MSEVKNIRISHKDYVSGKYHTVSMRSGAGVDGVSHGDIFEAKVVLDDNGNILAESYSEKYRKEMMGKKVKEIKEVKKKGGGKMLYQGSIPFIMVGIKTTFDISFFRHAQRLVER